MDPIWLLVAMLLGLGAQQLGLPALVGFLAAGFVLHGFGEQGGQLLDIASQVGVLLLLFTIGLKLRLSSFLAPVVWGGATAHMALTCAVVVGVFALLGTLSLAFVSLNVAMVIAFALSFSSTVLAVKVFEERGEMRTRHAVIAVGILIIQDVLAVGFLLLADEKWPSVWALILLALPLLRPLLLRLMTAAGHGEMLVLFGITAAIVGAELFDAVGMKDGLGALVLGVMLSGHSKSIELTRSLMSLKDFFLIGFFLSIGLIGLPTIADLLSVSLLVLLLLPLKMFLFFVILTRFRLRARTAFIATLGLATFSEFGLIVANEGAEAGWLGEQWLVVLAISAALSFVLASFLNARGHELYGRFEKFLCRFETRERLSEDLPPDIGDVEVLIMGMGRVGRGAYRRLVETYGSRVCGVDADANNIASLKQSNYNVIFGDAEDIDFWRHVISDRVRLVMLALPAHEDAMLAIKWLRAVDFRGQIGAVTKYEDDRAELLAAGVHAAFNFYSEAGEGFAEHVQRELTES
jgi:glutathione-regulated potassium-efflux system ancillary protein KefC